MERMIKRQVPAEHAQQFESAMQLISAAVRVRRREGASRSPYRLNETTVWNMPEDRYPFGEKPKDNSTSGLLRQSAEVLKSIGRRSMPGLRHDLDAAAGRLEKIADKYDPKLKKGFWDNISEERHSFDRPNDGFGDTPPG